MFNLIGKFITYAGISIGSCYVLYKIITGLFGEGDQSCRTVKKSKIYKHQWTIENFNTITGNVNLKSVFFSGTTLDGVLVMWRYCLTQKNDRITIHMVCSSDAFNQRVEINLAVGSSGIRKYSGIIGTGGCFDIGYRQRVLELCSFWTGSLKLRFEVSFVKHILLEGYTSKALPALPKAPPSDLEQFSDVTLKVGPETFRVHKAILAGRSTVFAAMFQDDMRQSQRNEITITDTEPTVFKEVLRSIYTDKVEGLPGMAGELLAAADRYDLARLKALID